MNHIEASAKATRFLESHLQGKSNQSFRDHVEELLGDVSPHFTKNNVNSPKAFTETFNAYLGFVNFENVFTNVANSLLAKKWSQSSQTWKKWVNTIELNDFRETEIVSGSIIERPELLIPGAEIKQKGIYGEKRLTSLDTYANIINFDRSTLFDDSVGAIESVMSSISFAFERSVGDAVYGLLKDNPASFGSKEIFHTDHNNIIGKTSDFADDLGSALEAMYGQKMTISDTVPEFEEDLQIQPKYVLVSPKFSATASKVVGEYNKALAEEHKLMVLIEPRLSGYTGWFLACDNMFASLGLFTLKGSNAPLIETKRLHARDGLDVKYRWDYKVDSIDYRGLVRVS